MASLNVFVVVDCKKRKPILVTHSARKAKNLLEKGMRVEVWADNAHVSTIYSKHRDKFIPYVWQEREYIGKKQKKAEERNKRRKGHDL